MKKITILLVGIFIFTGCNNSQVNLAENKLGEPIKQSIKSQGYSPLEQQILNVDEVLSYQDASKQDVLTVLSHCGVTDIVMPDHFTNISISNWQDEMFQELAMSHIVYFSHDLESNTAIDITCEDYDFQSSGTEYSGINLGITKGNYIKDNIEGFQKYIVNKNHSPISFFRDNEVLVGNYDESKYLVQNYILLQETKVLQIRFYKFQSENEDELVLTDLQNIIDYKKRSETFLKYTINPNLHNDISAWKITEELISSLKFN